MVWILFYYGLIGWLMYVLMGMVLGYFSYCYNLLFIICLVLYLIFGKWINGFIGYSVDIVVVIGIIFGIVIIFGIGVVQFNYGLSVLFDILDLLVVKVVLIVLLVIIVIILVIFGVDKGICVFFELNVVFVLGLILFVLFMGDIFFLFNVLVFNVGDYVNCFMGMMLNSFVFDWLVEWMNNWMFFFWVWWVVWLLFVGLFLVCILCGCIICQFVMGILIIFFIFILLWLLVFGNSVLYEIIYGDVVFVQEVMVYLECGFYSLLVQYLVFIFSVLVVIIIGLLFYVIFVDFGVLVLGNFILKLKDINSDVLNWLCIFWLVVIGLLIFGMLMINGILVLQNIMVIMGLLFSFVIFFVMVGLYKFLKVEDYCWVSVSCDIVLCLMGFQDCLSWKKCLLWLMNYFGMCYIKLMMEMVCYLVMEEVVQELWLCGVVVELKSLLLEEGENFGYFDLLVYMGDEQNFIYKIWLQQYLVLGFIYWVCSGKFIYYWLEIFLLEGSQGNDLMDYSKEQVIIDIFDQYEWYLNFIYLYWEVLGNSVMFLDG